MKHLVLLFYYDIYLCHLEGKCIESYIMTIIILSILKHWFSYT